MSDGSVLFSGEQSPAAPRPHRGRRPAALALAAAAAVLVAGVPGVAEAAPSETFPYSFGGIVPTETIPAETGLAQLAQQAQALGGEVRAQAALPPSVDLTGFAVPAGNQGPHGACVSFTTGYTLSGWLSRYTSHIGAPFEPMYVYNQVNGGSDTRGTSYPANFSILESQGILEAVDWTRPFSDFRSKPTAAQKAKADQHKLTAHTTLFSGAHQGQAGQIAIETALANNQPVGIGFPVYAAFSWLNSSDSTFTLADATGKVLGNHAVAVLGYDENGVIIENSWTAQWGDAGFATLGWDFVNEQVYEAHAIGTFAAGANSLTPVVTKVSAPTVSSLGGGSLTVTASRLYSVDTSQTGAVRFVSVADPSVSVPATVTASTATTLAVTVPKLPADGQYRVVVTGGGGAGAPNAVLDVVTAARPFEVALGKDEVARSNAAAPVTLTGSGFGATRAAFAANKVTATVSGKRATATWVDDTRLKVTVPPAAVGTTAEIVVLRDGVPSEPVSVSYLPPAPIVTKLAPARVPGDGGASVTVTVRNNPTASDPGTVTLISATDPAVTTTAPITGRTATTLTFTAPAAPDGASGNYHVLVSGAGGRSLPVNADVLGFRTAPTATTSATQVSAAGGTVVTLTGSGFGTTAAAFAKTAVTATVAGRSAPVKWVSETALKVTVPAGIPGAAAPIVLLRDKVPGTPITGVTYAAAIMRVSAAAGAAAGWTTSVSGAGFAGSGSWALLDADGATVAALPVVPNAAALKAASSGVVLTSGTAASVKLPATTPGRYRLTFVPDQTTFPGASVLPTDQAYVTVRA